MVQHLIAAIDGSAHADHALQHAGQLAQESQARLTVVHIVNLQTIAHADGELIAPQLLLEQAQQRGRRILQQAQQQLRQQYALPTQSYLGESWHGKRDMARVLSEFAVAVDADLLVLATHGKTGRLHMLMGSFTENLIRHAPCPLLLVRSRADLPPGA